MVAIFKVSYFLFLNCFASFLLDIIFLFFFIIIFNCFTHTIYNATLTLPTLHTLIKILTYIMLHDISFLPALPSITGYSLLLHLDPREKICLPIQDLFCSHKPLTYLDSASVQCGLLGRTEYPFSQALAFFTQTGVSYWTLLLSRKSYTCTFTAVQSF